MALSKQCCGRWAARGSLAVLLVLMIALLWLLAQPQLIGLAAVTPEHGDEEHHESPLAIVWRWGNFLILFGGLAWYFRKPLLEFLESRARGIQEGLANGRQAREEAERKMAEIESRLSSLDREINDLKEKALQEAREERDRMIESAKLEAEKILELARREIDGLRKSAYLDLKGHVAELAVRLAEERLRGSIGPLEQQRIIDRFLQSLETGKN